VRVDIPYHSGMKSGGALNLCLQLDPAPSGQNISGRYDGTICSDYTGRSNTDSGDSHIRSHDQRMSQLNDTTHNGASPLLRPSGNF
jgi:hypothetical protein